MVAEMAMRLGVLTIGVVSKPFLFEGPRRRRMAEEGADRMKQYVDTLVTVPKLLKLTTAWLLTQKRLEPPRNCSAPVSRESLAAGVVGA